METLFLFHLYFARLKEQPRVGWNGHGREVENSEGVGAHTGGVVTLVMGVTHLLAHLNLNWLRAMQIAMVHDIIETIVGDINVHVLSGQAREELKALKKRLEHEAICQIREELGSGFGDLVYELWMEYENASSPEAQVVKELDKIEVLLQSMRYHELKQQVDPWGFWHNVRDYVKTPELIEFLDTVVYPKLPKTEEEE